MRSFERQKEEIYFVHVFSEKNCIRKEVSVYLGEKRWLHFTRKELSLAFSFSICLQKISEDCFCVNEREISRDEWISLTDQAGEEIGIIISKREEKFVASSWILLNSGKLWIGSGFQNEIYYDCFFTIPEKQILISCQENEVNLILEKWDESRFEKPVYVNGKRCFDNVHLQTGDRIDCLGLQLYLLSSILVCHSYFGTMRVAKRKTWNLGRALWNTPVPEEKMVQRTLPEKSLHLGEIEVELPEIHRDLVSQSLLLQIGPSFTMFLPMLLMTLIGDDLRSGGGSYYKISLIMSLSMAIMTSFWGTLNFVTNKRKNRRKEAKERETYWSYLSELEKELRDGQQENRELLLSLHPRLSDLITCNEICQNQYQGEIRQFFVRLSIGSIPFQVQLKVEERKSKGQGAEMKQVLNLKERYRMLSDVPIGIDLSIHQNVGFVGEEIYPVFLQSVLSLSLYHPSKKLKMVLVYHRELEEEKAIAECIKWLPHFWNAEGKRRMIVGSEEEVEEIIQVIRKEMEEQSGKETRFLLLLLAPEFLLKEALFMNLSPGKMSESVCFYIADEMTWLPEQCSYVVRSDKEGTQILDYKQRESRKDLLFDTIDHDICERVSRKLISEDKFWNREQESIGGSSFLSLFGCSFVEDCNLQRRWDENKYARRLKVPIGIGDSGKRIYLDVHERAHGPHGLIAGTTGSGKSELLQTYLLSIAVSFSPETCTFFIIDYKGGGMGEVLKTLPHCSGLISNLSGTQITRALISIKSENIRRQRMLKEAGVNHISDYISQYLEGKVELAMPHLLIVVDEFAELKREEPEFMQEIISVAQVGRSLGVHLILATQKPAGTVDERIFSNTRFRLCLKVADRQDSMDMLHKADAFGLTESGECYLQVGNDELYEHFYAGYGGCEYQPGIKEEKKAYLISDTGKRFQVEEKKESVHESQRDAVIAHIQRVAQKENYEKARPLWMKELKPEIDLDELNIEEEENESLQFCIGLCDDPAEQRQYPIFYKPEQDGNLVICGAAATGKSTLLQLLLYQMYQSDIADVRFMVSGIDSELVSCFEKMPGCIGSLKRAAEAESFFYHVERLFLQRKKLLSGISFLQYRKYREKEPFLFLVIDNYGSFRTLLEDRYTNLIETLAKEGVGYGFFLILTASNIGMSEIPSRLFEKCKTALALGLDDKAAYSDVLRRYQIPFLPNASIRGRGLCRQSEKILEFQVPVIYKDLDDYRKVLKIREEASIKRKEMQDQELFYFPRIPENPTFRELYDSQTEKKLFLGYDEKTGYPVGIEVRNSGTFCIAGVPESGKKNLLYGILYGIQMLGIEKEKILCIDELADYTKEHREEKHYEDTFVIAICTTGREREASGHPLYEKLLENQSGIYLGGDCSRSRILNFDDLSYAEQGKKEKIGIGYLRAMKGARMQRILIPKWEEREEKAR